MLRQHVKRDGTAKKKFPDQAAALGVARRQNGDGPRKVRAYQCDVCGDWHIGARRGGKRKAGALPAGKRVAGHHEHRS